MYVCVPHVCDAHGGQKSIRSPRTGFTDHCEAPCGYWGLTKSSKCS